jgi:hypothetical protein
VVFKHERSDHFVRQFGFHGLNRLVKVETQIILNDVQQVGDLFGLERMDLDAAQHLDRVVRFQE